MAQNGAESIPTDMQISYLKTMLPIEWQSSSNTHRNPIDRCFREANMLSDFRFEGKDDNFWKHFYEEFI